jgi:hypothetical protein
MGSHPRGRTLTVRPKRADGPAAAGRKSRQSRPKASTQATLYEKLNFNVTRDITPVAGIGRVPLVMEMNLSVPTKTVSEFIA